YPTRRPDAGVDPSSTAYSKLDPGLRVMLNKSPDIPHATIGDALEAIDTPALLVDLDAFERNLAMMKAALDARDIRLRPHAKSHKCPEIAKLQIASGAIGICCQKVGEAEAFVAAGVDDVLVTNQIVGASKLARLAALAREARLGVLVDDAANVAALGSAMREAG